MRLLFLGVLMVLIASSASSQIIDNATGITLLDEPEFNPVFIRANNIAPISGEFSVKRESDIIRSAKETVMYHFDRVGRLVQIDNIRKSGGNTEMVSTIFRYDNDGTLIDKIISDVTGATSYSYSYDEQDRLISETCSRMESPRDTLIPAGPKRTEIYTESFRYTELDNGLKKVTYNSYDRPYLEEFSYYDEHGYLKEQSQRYLMNNKRSRTLYAYNERGLMEHKEMLTDLSKSDTTRLEYNYDTAGNLLSAQEFRNSVLNRRIEFLYEPATWLLDARLTKVEETELIRIIRYKTVFRD